MSFKQSKFPWNQLNFTWYIKKFHNYSNHTTSNLLLNKTLFSQCVLCFLSKKLMGSMNSSLKIDGLGWTHQTHANATTGLFLCSGAKILTKVLLLRIRMSHKLQSPNLVIKVAVTQKPLFHYDHYIISKCNQNTLQYKTFNFNFWNLK